MQRKREKITKQQYEKFCKKFWRMIILTLHPICECCRKKKSQHPHHFILRSQCSELKFNIDNGVGLCANCHRKRHWQEDPEIDNTVIQSRGQAWADRLYQIKNHPIKISYYNLDFVKNMYIYLYGEYNKLKQHNYDKRSKNF